MKKLRYCLAATAVFAYGATAACTNFIVTRGASTDGSVMVTYAADSHALYGAQCACCVLMFIVQLDQIVSLLKELRRGSKEKEA